MSARLTMAGWLSPAQLAEELSTEDRPVTAEWVRRHMSTGDIPSIRVGNRRWFTPACREAMEQRVKPPPIDIAGFGYTGRPRRVS